MAELRGATQVPVAGYRDALTRLATAQKSSRGAPGYSRWVNRRLGRFIAAWAYVRGLRPNQVTAISMVFTAAGIVAIALAPTTWPAAGGIVVALLVGYAVDSADGQLARLRGGGTPAGEWLDHVTDAVKATSLHIAVLICWFRRFDVTHNALLLIPLGYTLVSSVFFFAVILSEQLRRAHGRPAAAADGSAPVLRSIVVLPADYGVLCLVFVLLPLHTAFGTAYTLMLAANLCFLLGALRNWFREMSAFSVDRS